MPGLHTAQSSGARSAQSLAQQLDAIATHAQRLAAESRQALARQAEIQQRRAEAGQRAWATRVDNSKVGKTALGQIVIDRLPTGASAALSLSEITALVADVETGTTGLATILSLLHSQGSIARTGERRKYRYFKP